MNRLSGRWLGSGFAPVWLVLLLFGAVKVVRGAPDRIFSIPVEVLKNWSENIVISMDAKITGHSGVHSLQSDCEMHFGGQSDSFQGIPPGLVLEPANLCVQPFFGKTKLVRKDWLTFGESLVGATVKVRGVPRIWPEHLIGKESDSNPHHAVEIHPLTVLKRGTLERDFSSFIFDPEEYEGGLKPE